MDSRFSGGCTVSALKLRSNVCAYHIIVLGATDYSGIVLAEDLTVYKFQNRLHVQNYKMGIGIVPTFQSFRDSAKGIST